MWIVPPSSPVARSKNRKLNDAGPSWSGGTGGKPWAGLPQTIVAGNGGGTKHDQPCACSCAGVTASAEAAAAATAAASTTTGATRNRNTGYLLGSGGPSAPVRRDYRDEP